MIQDGLNPRSLGAYKTVLEQETCRLLNCFAKKPEHFLEDVRKFAASMVMQLAYGHTVESSDDYYVNLAETAVRATVETGAFTSSGLDAFLIAV
jgi:hypothetical protein